MARRRCSSPRSEALISFCALRNRTWGKKRRFHVINDRFEQWMERESEPVISLVVLLKFNLFVLRKYQSKTHF